MAADSGIAVDPNTWIPSTKIFRVAGHLVGFCGTVGGNWKAFLAWVEKGMPMRRPKIVIKDESGELNDFVALVLSPDRDLWYFHTDCTAIPVERDYHAIGTGAQAALGAMFRKATPRQAIEAAKAHDCSTRGDIQVLTL